MSRFSLTRNPESPEPAQARRAERSRSTHRWGALAFLVEELDDMADGETIRVDLDPNRPKDRRVLLKALREPDAPPVTVLEARAGQVLLRKGLEGAAQVSRPGESGDVSGEAS